jgi:hypothetical protein
MYVLPLLARYSSQFPKAPFLIWGLFVIILKILNKKNAKITKGTTPPQ